MTMLNSLFYTNTKTKVLRKVPSGKIYQNTTKTAGLPRLEKNLPSNTLLTISYLKNGQVHRVPDFNLPQYQSAQKGGVCGLAGSKIHFFGPYYDGPQREIEIKISNYRKICTYLTELKDQEDAFVDWFNQQIEALELAAENDPARREKVATLVSENNLNIEFGHVALDNYQHEIQSSDKQFAQFLLAQFTKIQSESNVWPHEFLITLLKEFLQDTGCHDFSYFVLDHQARAIIQEITRVSTDLNFDMQKNVSEALKRKHLQSVNDMSLDELATIYDRALLNHIWELQGYTVSSWHPVQGVETLLEEMRTGICLAEIDYNLIKPDQKTVSHQFASKNDKGYLIYDIVEIEGAEIGVETHLIKIIGVDLDSGGHIYFIDPNDPSSPDEPRIIHKIPYALFCKILQDQHGWNVSHSMNFKELPPVLYRATIEEDIPILSPLSPKIAKRERSPQIEQRKKFKPEEDEHSPNFFSTKSNSQKRPSIIISECKSPNL